MLSPRLLLYFYLLSLVGCPAPRTKVPDAAPGDPRVAWLKRNATPIRSINPEDLDFSDLAPIRDLVGDARIVMLGERTHGDGATFAAKIRLIEFLHRELGFEVLAFEAGFYDCRRAWGLLLSGDGSRGATNACMYGLWQKSGELDALRRYLVENANTARPLELAGFDCQITDKEVTGRTAEALEAFLLKSSPSLAGSERLSAITSAAGKLRDYGRKRSPEEREQDRAALADLALLVDSPESAAAHPEKEVAFFRQLARSLVVQEQGNWLFQSRGVVDSEQVSLRDAQMAENLIWLAEQRYPGKKIIVWAANFHILLNPEGVEGLFETSEQARGFAPMGQLIRQHFGASALAIGFITAGGKSDDDEEKDGVIPAPPDSLEGLLTQAGFSYALLDLRAKQPGSEFLREKRPGRFGGPDFRGTEWAKIFDTVFFIREMTRSSAPEP